MIDGEGAGDADVGRGALCPSCGGQHADVSWRGPDSELMICTEESEEGGIPPSLSLSFCASVFSKHQDVGYRDAAPVVG